MVASICSNSVSRTASCLRSPSFSSAVGLLKSLFIWYGSPYLSSLLCLLTTAWYKTFLASVNSCRYLSLVCFHFILLFKLNFMGLDSMSSTINEVSEWSYQKVDIWYFKQIKKDKKIFAGMGYASRDLTDLEALLGKESPFKHLQQLKERGYLLKVNPLVSIFLEVSINRSISLPVQQFSV